LCLIATALFLRSADTFTLEEKAVITILISIVVVNCGVLFETKKWVVWSEWIRIILYPVLLIALTYAVPLAPVYYGVAIGYMLISSTWFYAITRKQAYAQVA
jgi:alkylglycerol monooxygenase